jgi:hypothetical protein
VDVSQEDLVYYSGLGPYAFAIDRESTPTAAREDGATGMRRRIDAILCQARAQGLYLPEPTLRTPAVAGELPYIFEDDCAWHWFVDGTTKRATGYAISPHARPQLWRALLLAQCLVKRGFGPKAFLVGEGTRLFRDERWLTSFVHTLWGLEIKLFCEGFGEVTRQTLSSLIAYVNAVSGWLGAVTAGARAVREAQHRIFHNKPPFGVQFSPDRSRVFADPVTWPLLCDMVERLADGRLASMADATLWLQEQGHSRSIAWLGQFLWLPILDGSYRSYHRDFVPRVLVQKDGLLSDLDITPGGGRRYLERNRGEGQVWAIEHPHGTHPIPASLLSAARAKVKEHRGRRPRTPEIWVNQLIPQRLMRCAICGHGVSEKAQRMGARLPDGTRAFIWGLNCRQVATLGVRCRCTTEEARAMALPEHIRYRAGQISETVWKTLASGLRGAEIKPASPDPSIEVELAELQMQLAQVQQEFERFQDRVLAGHAGDLANETVRAYVEKRRSGYLSDLDALHQQTELLGARRLAAPWTYARVQAASMAIKEAPEAELDPESKRAIIAQAVDRIVVNLETGDFTIYLDRTHEAIGELQGRMASSSDQEKARTNE